MTRVKRRDSLPSTSRLATMDEFAAWLPEGVDVQGGETPSSARELSVVFFVPGGSASDVRDVIVSEAAEDLANQVVAACGQDVIYHESERVRALPDGIVSAWLLRSRRLSVRFVSQYDITRDCIAARVTVCVSAASSSGATL